jgi:hypothetical protein
VEVPSTDDETELRRQEAKAVREWARDAHPFDRLRRQDAAQELFDDETRSDAILIAFPGAADRLGMPSVDFFEQIADWHLRRVYIRNLVAAIERPHSLGSTVLEIAESLSELTRGYRRTVFIGTSLGGFHALLFGTLANADAVVGVNPITSIQPSVLEEAGDDRWDALVQRTSEAWMSAYGDISRLWERYPSPRVVIHYPDRYKAYAVQAERMAEWPNVTLVPHHENSPMDKIHHSGELRELLGTLLWPNQARA